MDVPQRIVIGLGNPGAEYDGTRHNIGFAVLDLLAQQLALPFARLERGEEFSGRVKAKVAAGRTAAGAFVLVKPLTFMNLSGLVAGAMARAWALPPTSFFVVLDDLDLPLGRIRIRPSGSAGGHRGLSSIESALASRDTPRLRLGIGRPVAGRPAPGAASQDHAPDERDPVRDFVLERFGPEERKTVEDVIVRAAQAVRDWLDGATVEILMNRYNATEPPPGGSQPDKTDP